MIRIKYGDVIGLKILYLITWKWWLGINNKTRFSANHSAVFNPDLKIKSQWLEGKGVEV